MHWAFQIATNLIQQHEDQPTPITCASGVSPSGYVHVGNFREIATTYFVTRALKELGATPRYILSWDDYDRLRKIPKNVTGVAEENIGMPYTKVAPPAGSETSAASYGAYFEAMFIDDLAKLNIKPEFIFETERYENGAYDDELALVLTNRKKIYDILSRFRTEAANDTEREVYFPISLYCDQCGHDMTTISAYDEKARHSLMSVEIAAITARKQLVSNSTSSSIGRSTGRCVGATKKSPLNPAVRTIHQKTAALTWQKPSPKKFLTGKHRYTSPMIS